MGLAGFGVWFALVCIVGWVCFVAIDLGLRVLRIVGLFRLVCFVFVLVGFGFPLFVLWGLITFSFVDLSWVW